MQWNEKRISASQLRVIGKAAWVIMKTFQITKNQCVYSRKQYHFWFELFGILLWIVTIWYFLCMVQQKADTETQKQACKVLEMLCKDHRLVQMQLK